MQLEPGTLLGPYQILALIGVGGMGQVYRARDTRLERQVAIKVISPAAKGNDAALERFRREARAIAALTHPHICTLYDVGREGDVEFLVMECLEGDTLDAVLERRKSRSRRSPAAPTPRPEEAGGRHGTGTDAASALPYSEVLSIATHLADALAAAHRAGIIHRDLKPGNVMLTPTGVKVLDFGLAKLPSAPHAVADTAGQAAATTAATQPGLLVGTLPYMAPEQIQGRSVDARTDIFALGGILYEMTTGRRAFAGESPVSLIASILEDDPPPLGAAQGVPAGFERLVRKCLAKNPDARWQSASDVTDELRWLASGSGSGPVVGTAPASSAASLLKRLTRRYAVTAGIVAALALCTFLFLYVTSASLEATDSVMVLPFTNVQKDAEVEYLADGLSESLTNTLSHLRTVRVIARTTAFAYKGREFDVRTLGRELDVRIIITGSVSRTNDRLRVQADVVDASAGTQLWGKQYESKADEILQIQEDVVRNVSERLRLDVNDATRRQLTRAPTSSSEAFDIYLRGRHALSRSTVADTQKGIDHFKKALELDPGYGLAYTGLADSYLGLSGMYLVPKDAMAKARAAAARALELDPTLPEAHVSMGVTKAFYDYAWRESEEQFEQAIALNPFEPSVRLWYGWILVLRGNHEAGIAQALLAHKFDPLSAFIETGLGQMYYLARRPEVAIQRLRNVVGSDPAFFNGHYALGVAHVHAAQYAEAVQALEEASRLDSQQPQPMAYLTYAYAKGGNVPLAQLRFAELKKLHESRYVSGYVLAVALLGLGHKQEAIRSLEKAYEERDDMLTMVNVDSLWDELRGDPRFRELVGRMGFD